MSHTYIHNGILLGHKKNEILPFVTTWVDLEDILLNEMSQTEKDKYHMISLIIISSRSIHAVANGKISFFLGGE